MNYLKDTEVFWRKRKLARKKLDRKRAKASLEEKARIAEILRENMRFLRSGRINT